MRRFFSRYPKQRRARYFPSPNYQRFIKCVQQGDIKTAISMSSQEPAIVNHTSIQSEELFSLSYAIRDRNFEMVNCLLERGASTHLCKTKSHTIPFVDEEYIDNDIDDISKRIDECENFELKKLLEERYELEEKVLTTSGKIEKARYYPSASTLASAINNTLNQNLLAIPVTNAYASEMKGTTPDHLIYIITGIPSFMTLQGFVKNACATLTLTQREELASLAKPEFKGLFEIDTTYNAETIKFS